METNFNPFEYVYKRLDQIYSLVLTAKTVDISQSDFVDIDEACKILNLRKSGIYRKVMNKEIPYYKTGKKLMFRRSELIEFITRNKRQKEPDQGLTIEK